MNSASTRSFLSSPSTRSSPSSRSLLNSPTTRSSPSYKHLKTRQTLSPIEMKEKMRKDYKSKIQNCRDLLLNRMRGSVGETDLRSTLDNIYKSMFNFQDKLEIDEEDSELLEEIKNELIQEELDWWIEEYEKAQLGGFDWASIEREDVICPVCQKTNFTLQNNILSCPNCKVLINTSKSLLEIKQSLMSAIEKHSNICNSEAQFSIVPETNEKHIYLICLSCSDMILVV